MDGQNLSIYFNYYILYRRMSIEINPQPQLNIYFHSSSYLTVFIFKEQNLSLFLSIYYHFTCQKFGSVVDR